MEKAQIDEILMPNDTDKASQNEARVRDGFWTKLKKTLSQIPFCEDVVAAYYCALDPETPARVRGILFAALAYFILPVDLVPDFLAGFGLTDDLTIISTALATVAGHIKESHRIAARTALNDQSDKQS